MTATGSKAMNEDYCKGLALSAALYGLLILTCILMVIV